jgi:predicted aspartyl protease
MRTGSLFVARAAVMGPTGTKVIKLLVDTGSTYTVLPVEVLESIGISPAESKTHERIATGSGYIIAPKVTAPSLMRKTLADSDFHKVTLLLRR